jgi:hypothetical protein
MRVTEIRIVPHTNVYTVTKLRNTSAVVHDDKDIAVSMMRVNKVVVVLPSLVATVEADLNSRQIERMTG